MAKWITFAPILGNHRIHKTLEGYEDFEIGYVKFKRIPDWLKSEEIVKYLSFYNKEEIKDAKWMFISEYEANSLGEPDPEWRGEKQRGKQHSAVERIQISNLALWIARPSSLTFNMMFHVDSDKKILRECFTRPPIKPHSNDDRNYHSKKDLELANDISLSIQNLQRNSSIWLASRTLYEALTSDIWEVRFLLLWIVLEALFGASTEITYRISQRIGFLLSVDKKTAFDLYKEAKVSYNWRSKIVHGKRHKLEQSKSAQVLYNTECLVRNAVLKILKDKELIKIFSSSDNTREEYLDNLVFV